MLAKLYGVWSLIFLVEFCLCGDFRILTHISPGIPDTFDLDPRPYVKLSTGYYYLELKKRTNWFEAYEACRKMNGALVTFETQEELNAVVRYIKGNTYINNFWTSGTDYAHQGRYVWFATGQIIELDAWWPGEPNNFNDAEHCAELSFKYQVGQQSGMNDERCTLARAYICEAEAPQTASLAVWA